MESGGSSKDDLRILHRKAKNGPGPIELPRWRGLLGGNAPDQDRGLEAGRAVRRSLSSGARAVAPSSAAVAVPRSEARSQCNARSLFFAIRASSEFGCALTRARRASFPFSNSPSFN